MRSRYVMFHLDFLIRILKAVPSNCALRYDLLLMTLLMTMPVLNTKVPP